MGWTAVQHSPYHLLAASIRAVERVTNQEFVNWGYDYLESTARRLTPVATGLLESTVAVREVAPFHITLGAYTYYASYVEYGTSSQPGRYYITGAIIIESPFMGDRIKRAINTPFYLPSFKVA